jgi:flavin reductase (DIM6/NTAB) family NADH-FMN oxidoreductase RutF
MKLYSSADIACMDRLFRTTFINSISGFKSLQMVGTKGVNGSSNLAVFNSIFHVGAHPPYIGMVVRPDGNDHETFQNILATKVYTLNNVLENSFMASHQTSARYAVGQSEFEACGFTEEYVDDFPAPFVKESNIKIGLEFKEFLPILLNKTKIVIGEVKFILIDDEIVSADGFVDLGQANSVTSAGLDAYYTTNPLGRLTYAKTEKQPQFLNVNTNKEE